MTDDTPDSGTQPSRALAAGLHGVHFALWPNSAHLSLSALLGNNGFSLTQYSVCPEPFFYPEGSITERSRTQSQIVGFETQFPHL